MLETSAMESTLSTSQPPNTQPTPDAEEAVLMPHESPLHSVHSLGRDEGSLLINKLTDLYTSLSNKERKFRRRVRVVESDDEEDLGDPSKQGMTEQLGVFSAATALVDAAKGRRSVETAQTYTRRRGSVSIGSGRVSTANRTVSTADVSTASELGSTAGVKAKDKGKAIMQESEPPKKVKKRLDERKEVAAEPTQAQQIN
ncbi:hypothetical protein Tco_0570181 [Tanacetum coccineum]